jgi:hypothetical protein
MCKICNHKYGSIYHQLYWFVFFLKKKDFTKAKTSIYHLFNKKAYKKWFEKRHELQRMSMIYDYCKIAPVDDDYAADGYIEEAFNMDIIDFFNKYYNLK